MKTNFLSSIPSPGELEQRMQSGNFPEFREVNGHIHTPFSFSAFEDIATAFMMAKDEGVSVLGINDFFVTDGYDEFLENALAHNIFPLFNIEFIGLMKEEQQKGIRINDPNNPGRIYFCGKGLDYPYSPPENAVKQLAGIISESQEQMRQMISRLNGILVDIKAPQRLSYEEIKKRYARDLLRERHLAKAIRVLAGEHFPDEAGRIAFIEALYGGKKSKAGLAGSSALENEIRSNLLKAGGAAFVEENESAFLELDRIKEIITGSGGIPCYPVLLDDAKGNFTEYEADPEKLHTSLKEKNIGCIELIPGRNDHDILKKFSEFFYGKGFIVLFGTEHNSPEMIPIKVSARSNRSLNPSLLKIGWESACVIAAHQYLRAHGQEGYIGRNNKPRLDERDNFAALGQKVIEFFINEKTR